MLIILGLKTKRINNSIIGHTVEVELPIRRCAVRFIALYVDEPSAQPLLSCGNRHGRSAGGSCLNRNDFYI